MLAGSRRSGPGVEGVKVRGQRHLSSLVTISELVRVPSTSMTCTRWIANLVSRHQRERRLRAIPAHRPAFLYKLPKSLAPKDVAPYTDACLTAYKKIRRQKASRHLLPCEYVGVDCFRRDLGIVASRFSQRLCCGNHGDRPCRQFALSRQSCGAHHSFQPTTPMSKPCCTAGRLGAEPVIDFVGEGDAIAQDLMTANVATLLVGYGGKIIFSPYHRHDHY